MILNIVIVMDNQAFEDDRKGEVKRILDKVVEDMEYGDSMNLRDINGNTVGSYSVED